MNAALRLLIVISAIGAAVWLLWTPYREAFDQTGQQLRNVNGGLARAADDMPRRYRRMECTGSVWSDKLQCDPALHEDGRR